MAVKSKKVLLLSFVCIAVIVFSFLFNTNVAYAESTTSEFNVYAYANRYVDLQKAYGGDLAAYEQHYKDHGIKEGRDGKPYPGNDIRNSRLTFVYISIVRNGVDYSAVFNPIYYLDTYTDLKKAYGNDQQKAFNHFISFGMKEGRTGISGFNVYAYANRYKDLQKAFGANLSLYYRHYAVNGKKEGRSCAPYEGNDVRNSRLNFTYISLVNNGVDYSAGFDPVTYVNTYSDLKKAFGDDQQKAFNHFITTGIYEGRTGNGSFNVYAYANRYADLFKAYSSNIPSYFNHYAKFGIKEGRDATGSDKSFNVTNYVTAVNLGSGQYKITIINPISSLGAISSISFPTWSEEKGQDDIVWYKGTKNKDGSWSVIVDGSNHLSTGKYITHVRATVNGKSVVLGSTSYVNNFDAKKYYGWVQRNGNYYFYNRTTGVMQKGGTQAGITLNEDGSAVMSDYAKEKLPVLVKAREIVESITNPSDSLADKKMKCYQYVADMPYLLKLYQFYQNKDNYACPDAVYANNLLNAYGDQDKCGGECVAEASALGYLYAELNFGDVYLLASGHGWIKAGDYYWDPLLVEDRGIQWYEYAPDNRKYEFSYKIN